MAISLFPRQGQRDPGRAARPRCSEAAKGGGPVAVDVGGGGHLLAVRDIQGTPRGGGGGQRAGGLGAAGPPHHCGA